MNSTHGNLARIISTGFVVTLIFSIALFWADAQLRKIGKEDLDNGAGLHLNLVLDLGEEELSDPNLAIRPPRVFCEFANPRYAESDVFIDILLEAPCWIAGYKLEPYPGQFGDELAHAGVHAARYDRQGLIVAERASSEAEEALPEIRYVGPKGFSNTPERALERFSNPQLCYHDEASTLFVYDIGLKTFFKIDLAQDKVTSKSWAEKSIIATGRRYLGKFHNLLQIHAHEASRLETDQEMKVRLEEEQQENAMMSYRETSPPDFIDPGMAPPSEPPKATRKRIPTGPSVDRVLPTSGPWAMDDQGTIYQVDRDTLLLSPPKGQLPACGKEKTHDPSRLLAYCTLPLFVDGQYFGLVAASLSRDSSEAVMVLLDQQGREIGRTASHLEPRSYRYGLVTSYARNVLDFAQPLVFSVASSIRGAQTEAITGYGNLFVLPLSMPARTAADQTIKWGDRLGTVVMWNVFTWCVGLLLAIAVIRDLRQRGMTKKAQHAWLFACMGFGWIAVITYLLTRPRLQFVTCTGCGKTRRIDQELCLNCEADWAMSDLQAPAWRVVD